MSLGRSFTARLLTRVCGTRDRMKALLSTGFASWYHAATCSVASPHIWKNFRRAGSHLGHRAAVEKRSSEWLVTPQAWHFSIFLYFHQGATPIQLVRPHSHWNRVMCPRSPRLQKLSRTLMPSQRSVVSAPPCRARCPLRTAGLAVRSKWSTSVPTSAPLWYKRHSSGSHLQCLSGSSRASLANFSARSLPGMSLCPGIHRI